MKKFEAGFIGAGNMGGALATAAAKQVTGERVAVACSSPAHSAAAAERLGCRAAAPEEILGGSKFVFLGVKPQMIDGVVQSLAAPIAASESIFVSMLAGVQLERLERLLGADKKIIRILPNTACAVGRASCSIVPTAMSRTAISRRFARSWRPRASSTPFPRR